MEIIGVARDARDHELKGQCAAGSISRFRRGRSALPALNLK